VIFGAIYKFLPFGSRSENSVLVNRSLMLTDRSLGRKIQSQCSPWRHGRWAEIDSGEGRIRSGRESAVVARRITWGSIPRVGWGGGATRDDVWRRHGSQASCASVPATWSAEEASSRLRKVQGLLVEAVVRLEGDGEARDRELAESMAMAASSSSTPVRQARNGETTGGTTPSIGGLGLPPTPRQRRAPAWAAREDG
jgi:hypothetical protein